MMRIENGLDSYLSLPYGKSCYINLKSKVLNKNRLLPTLVKSPIPSDENRINEKPQTIPIIYPNPFNDEVYIIYDSFIEEVKLFNLYGTQFLIDYKITDNKIEFGNLNKGIYFLQIKSSGNVYNYKLIK